MDFPTDASECNGVDLYDPTTGDHIEMGMMVMTVSNAYGDHFNRHFIRDVQPASLAQQSGFRDGMEILTIGDAIVMNQSHDDLVRLLGKLEVNEDINLVTRDVSTLEADDPRDPIKIFETFEERKIRVKLEKGAEPEVVCHDAERLNPESVKFHQRDPLSVVPVIMQAHNGRRCPAGSADTLTVRVQSDQLNVAPFLDITDDSFRLQWLPFGGFRVPKDKHELPELVLAVMIRHSQGHTSGGTSGRYLYLTVKNKKLLMQGRCGSSEGPRRIEEQNAFFAVRKDQTYCLRHVTQKDTYLSLDNDQKCIILREAESVMHLEYDDNMRFHTRESDSTDGPEPMKNNTAYNATAMESNHAETRNTFGLDEMATLEKKVLNTLNKIEWFLNCKFVK